MYLLKYHYKWIAKNASLSRMWVYCRIIWKVKTNAYIVNREWVSRHCQTCFWHSFQIYSGCECVYKICFQIEISENDFHNVFRLWVFPVKPDWLMLKMCPGCKFPDKVDWLKISLKMHIFRLWVCSDISCPIRLADNALKMCPECECHFLPNWTG